MRRAVIDVGSNSVLLVVGELQDGVWIPIAEESAITALGAGTKETALLSEIGMRDTLGAILRFALVAKELGATECRSFATMAARIATNAPSFLTRGAEQGTSVQVLSGDTEAQLGFEAVVSDPLFAGADRLSIVDPGGQSTELVTASKFEGKWSVDFRRSYPVGTLGLKSSHFPQERVDGLSVLRATQFLDDLIGVCYRPGESGEVVVLGAAGTNLVSVRDRLLSWEPEKVHGATLEYEEVSRSVGWMMPMTDSERAQIPGLEPGREKTVHLGAFVLERFLFALRAENCKVSIRGWRHAMLAKLDDYPL